MTPNERQEFLTELRATDEDYVRRKFTAGGYHGVQAEIVERHLRHRAEKRAEDLSRQQLAATQGSVYWSKAAAYVTLAGVVVAICVWLWPRK